MVKALREIFKDWSFPVLWFIVAMKQYFMTWDVAQLYCGGGVVLFCSLYIFLHLRSVVCDSVPKAVLTYFVGIALFALGGCLVGSGSIQGIVDILIFPTLFLFFYLKVATKKLSLQTMLVVALVFIPFSIWNAFRWRSMFDDSNAISAQSNAGNFVVALLPFVFLLQKRLYRWLAFAGIALAIFVSMKRSGIIIWGVFVLYELLFSNLGKGSFLKRIGVVLGGALVLLVAWLNFSQTDTVERVHKRLQLLSDDGGSGRVDLFFQGWSEWAHGGLLSGLIGQGPIGSWEFLFGVRYAYHNDVVEVLRTSGFLGFLLFCLVIFALGRASLKYKAQKLEYSELPFLCVCFFLLSMGMFSPLVGFTYYTMPTIALMGASFAFCRERQRIVPKGFVVQRWR